MPTSSSVIFAPTTGTVTSVNDANADTLILASNAERKGATFYNDSSAILYLLCASGTASTTNFTVELFPDDFFSLPLMQGGVYTGAVRGIWASDSTGAVRVTEYVA